ncbi:hypothetical protein [Streptomyces sp. FH025]|uniref:hypothetical protein n=1 Tax=Streptomyces sp. FH025 TaxID=2815937 RepID=UPI001A9FE701|nr:hypothetical protein [Streptomyces sp. FH025]MBO1414075.1 hypothetical protein [Streptomyces sp. FH025]
MREWPRARVSGRAKSAGNRDILIEQDVLSLRADPALGPMPVADRGMVCHEPTALLLREATALAGLP